MKRIAIVAAMPGELGPFLKSQAKEGWDHEMRGDVKLWRLKWPLGQGEWIAACAGAGQQAATRAFAAIEQDGPVSMVISIGWVGALDDRFVPGEAYRASGVIDQQTGERFLASAVSESADLKVPRVIAKQQIVPQGLKPFPIPGGTNGTAEAVPFQNSVGEGMLLPGTELQRAGLPGEELWLVTSQRVADEAEKQRLAAAYGAGLVDMEAAAVARLAAMRGIPFYAIKGVSDGFRDKLPDFNKFLGPRGEFQLARLILFVLPRPWLWPALVRMGENSRRASQAIAKDLLDLLGEQG
jgi:adenosylhomocysteine nucleosidase